MLKILLLISVIILEFTQLQHTFAEDWEPVILTDRGDTVNYVYPPPRH